MVEGVHSFLMSGVGGLWTVLLPHSFTVLEVAVVMGCNNTRVGSLRKGGELLMSHQW
jgi:hypothetical protein